MTAASVTKSCDLPGFCAGAVTAIYICMYMYTHTHTHNTHFMNTIELH